MNTFIVWKVLGSDVTLESCKLAVHTVSITRPKGLVNKEDNWKNTTFDYFPVDNKGNDTIDYWWERTNPC